MFNDLSKSNAAVDYLQLVTERSKEEFAEPQRAGEGYAWARLNEALRANPDLAGIARILNGVERRAKGLMPCPLQDLPLKDALRLVAHAKASVRGLNPEIEEQAVEEIAHVICEGGDGQYERLDNQSPEMRARYQRWAQTALNAARAVFEGRAI